MSKRVRGMNSVYRLICLGILSCFFMPAFTQNTGFAGKRVVLKLDAYSSILNRFPNVGAEVIVTRGLTLTADLNMGTQKVKQTYFGPFPANYDPKPWEGAYYTTKAPDKAEVTHTTFVVGFRKYFSNKKLIPAPHGAFFSAAYKKGTIKEISRAPGYIHSAKNLSYYGVQAGFGRQSFINSKLSVDFLLGLNFNKFDLNYTPLQNYSTAAVTGNFGHNLLRLYTNKGNTDKSSFNIGLFLNLSIGFLLF